jgi:hypothetical protein
MPYVVKRTKEATEYKHELWWVVQGNPVRLMATGYSRSPFPPEWLRIRQDKLNLELYKRVNA